MVGKIGYKTIKSCINKRALIHTEGLDNFDKSVDVYLDLYQFLG